MLVVVSQAERVKAVHSSIHTTTNIHIPTHSHHPLTPLKRMTSCRAVFHNFVDVFIDYINAGGHVWRRGPYRDDMSTAQVPKAKRLVAIGDLHGDFEKSILQFKVAGLINDKGDWIGKDTVCVQVGDVLDRGDDEIKLMLWLEKLKHEAAAAGGALHVINGNHETLTVQGRFRYATRGSRQRFDEWLKWYEIGRRLKALCQRGEPHPLQPVPDSVPEKWRSRFVAMRPGGPLATRFIGGQRTVLAVGKTLFVHGGILPQHLDIGLDRINKETQAWIMGRPGSHMPDYLKYRDAVVWARDYSDEEKPDCELLRKVLARAGFSRMVVGHTIQTGINAACDGMVIRVDVGSSRGCTDGSPQVLEILNDKHLNVLRMEAKKASKTAAA
eukprot:m.57297 g.57297  ORF g.57297 m.57297 type:complete len:384 (-) comp13449_c0_seq1:229-1380(-)